MCLSPLNVSEEFLEDVEQRLVEWGSRDSSFTLTQFFQEVGIGFPYFKRCCLTSPHLDNSFETVKAQLHVRWMDLAMRLDEMPKHRAGVLMRYLRLYDSHGLFEEREGKKAEQYGAAKAEREYMIESYQKQKMASPYQEMYEKNLQKKHREDSDSGA